MCCRHVFLSCLTVVLVLTGCSDQNGGRVKVDGTVKLKGERLKDGTVSFEPLDGQPSRATAVISAGEYSIPRANGLVPGKYLIRISAGDGKTAVNPVDPSQPPGPGGGSNVISKELVPADWNVKSNQERTVVGDGSNRFEFDIP